MSLFFPLFSPFLGVIFLSMALAPLGCVLLWKRLSFFSDGLSHACILGVALALWLKIHFLGGILLIALCMGFLLILTKPMRMLTMDTLFTSLSYTFFAGGLLCLSLQKQSNIALDDILFGDFLALRWHDAFLSFLLSLFVFIFFKIFWKQLIYGCLNEDLCQIHFRKNTYVQGVFILLCAISVAMGMYLMGAVLLPALVIFPAVCARVISQSPQEMILKACVISLISCSFGIASAFVWDLPPSPMMVLSFAFFFCVLLVYRYLMKRFMCSFL